MKKKKQIQIDGREQTDQPTSLDEIWGYNSESKYGTTDEDTYRQSLDELTKSDLEAHAQQIGVPIPEGIDRLKGNLMRQFRVYVNSLKRPPAPLRNGQIKIDRTIERILAEGK